LSQDEDGDDTDDVLQNKSSDSSKTPLGDLCPDIVQHILSFVPLKPRTRFKSVAQNWCSFITGLRDYSLPLPNSYGLVLFAKEWSLKLAGGGDATVFLTINDHLGVETATHENWITLTLPKAILIDSCNGLLLYADTDETRSYYTRFYVVSPLMKQFVAIPIPCKNKLSTKACVAIAFDDDDIDGHFQLISYSLEQDDAQLNVVKQSITCQIFSSETRGWSEHQATILNPSRPLIFQRKHSVSFYKKGKLYCLWEHMLLVYYVERKVFMAAQVLYGCSSSSSSNPCNISSFVGVGRMSLLFSINFRSAWYV
jgi:hypothetical protein